MTNSRKELLLDGKKSNTQVMTDEPPKVQRDNDFYEGKLKMWFRRFVANNMNQIDESSLTSN